jgi:hypothetical protein
MTEIVTPTRTLWAAILAAYLKGQHKSSADSQRDRGAWHMIQVQPSAPSPALEEDIPRSPANAPDVK